jgi:peptide deformylase
VGREWSLEGFEAVVAQHEVDHLEGKLFLDRVANLATDVFKRKTYL